MLGVCVALGYVAGGGRPASPESAPTPAPSASSTSANAGAAPVTSASPAPSSDRARADRAYHAALQRLTQTGEVTAALAMKPWLQRFPQEPRYHELYGAALVSRALAAATGEHQAGEGARAALFREGLEQMEEAARLQPEVPDYLITVGWACLADARLGITPDAPKRATRAKDAFEAAVKANPQAFTYWQSLADALRLAPVPPAATSPAMGSGKPAAPPENASSPPPALSESASSPPPAPPPIPREMSIYARLSASAPRDAGLHLLLYSWRLRREEREDAWRELRLAQQSQPGNGALLYLLAEAYLDRADRARDANQLSRSDDEEDRAYSALEQAQRAAGFNLHVYQPAWPDVLSRALQIALGDSLTPEALELYRRLDALAQKIALRGANSLADGDPWGAEAAHFAAFNLGAKLVNAAWNARDRSVIHLPELSGGMKIEERALAALRSLYETYGPTDRLPWVQNQQAQLVEVRRAVSEAVDALSPAETPSAQAPP